MSTTYSGTRKSRNRKLALGGLALFGGMFFATSTQLVSPDRILAAINPAASLKNWGLTNTISKSHIQAVDAWKLTEGKRDIVVAVIDTGIDSAHPDLAANIWKRKTSNPNTPVIHGWDFVLDRPNPRDPHGHGTHVAGIIGARPNPNTGVSGVARRISLMAVRYYSETNPGSVNLANTIKAIHWAIDQGAHIINYSGGGPEYNEQEYLALKRAEDAGILVVAAAGNERQNIDIKKNNYYPASYRLSNIISVAATDIHNNLLPSSNWGKRLVDVTAPGEDILSTLPAHRYGKMTGTSQATAFVTGVAALLLSQDPKLTPNQIREIIRDSSDRIPSLAERVASAGRINAYQALLSASKPKNERTTPGLLVARPQAPTPSIYQLLSAPLSPSTAQY